MALLAPAALAYPTVFPDGVTINDPGVSDGYAIIANGPVIYMLEPDGTPVHSWTPLTGWTYVTRPLENGHMLVKTGIGGGNYAIVELDWDSNVVWQFNQPPDGYPADTQFHHDWVRLDNGNTLILAHYTADIPAVSNRPTLEDFILEVSPTGEIVWEWYTADHIDEFGFTQERRDMIYERGGDWAHLNSVSVIPDDNPHTDPRFASGNLILSYRYQGIVVIDRGTDEIVWYKGDATVGQHEATMIPGDRPGAGNILTFDNGWAGAWAYDYNRYYSRILEIDPINETIEYEYNAVASDLPDWTFFSPSGSGVQRLPGGNTFICETTPGRIFEVDPAGTIVWEYISPFTNPGWFNGRNIYRAYKVPLDWASANFVPDMAVTLSNDLDPVQGGTPLSYTIQVDNVGADPAVAAQLNMDTPAGTRFQSIVAPPGWGCATPAYNGTGPINCTGSSMSSGQSTQFTLNVDVEDCVADGQTISHIATVTSDGSDGTPENNTTMISTAVTATTCDDGDLCTVDACAMDSSQCEFAPQPCLPAEPCQETGVCEATTGVCSYPVSPNGSPCDDGDATTCGDTCTDSICSGPVVPPPAEVDESVRVVLSDDVATISWHDPPGMFNVYGGTIIAGAVFEYNQTCLNPEGPQHDDQLKVPGTPPPGVAEYYLVTRVDECRDSSPGDNSTGTPRPNPFPCSTTK